MIEVPSSSWIVAYWDSTLPDAMYGTLAISSYNRGFRVHTSNVPALVGRVFYRLEGSWNEAYEALFPAASAITTADATQGKPIFPGTVPFCHADAPILSKGRLFGLGSVPSDWNCGKYVQLKDATVASRHFTAAGLLRETVPASCNVSEGNDFVAASSPSWHRTSAMHAASCSVNTVPGAVCYCTATELGLAPSTALVVNPVPSPLEVETPSVRV
jgi:hypothetical protein